MALDDGSETMVQVGFVAGNARRKLRHEIGVVEALLFLGVEICFWAAHPKHVAVQNDFAMAQRLTVVANETFERERKQPVHAGVHEFCRLAGLLAEEMG